MAWADKPAPRPGRRLMLLGGAAAAAGFGYWWQRRQPLDHNHPRLTAAEAYAQARAGVITLVDIRTPQEWRASGVPVGSHQIDLRRGDFIEALQAAAGPDLSAPVALICARGVRSARMTLKLAEAGFTNVIDVPEGVLGSAAGAGWIAGNLPVARWEE
ncbi:rhodanese-like domain-containing protein [Leisingera daeponensis]|uniref:Rhodanese-like domain-containing protein n=1 Tax=Leisingera daeponensis TaxID=405746 RepID=A0ABS7NBY9_9RHOB|nr:rhodanese-like domain-containing protein [Leisingera daeponensis]MBY6138680.1 rhodanese-like domain-containing protein [Leisingera daeponensis]